MIKIPAILIVNACLNLTLAAPALALNARTWISGTGVDQAGCGPVANPCRTLQYAHDQTSAGGEIDVKDSSGYGSVIITKAISIVGTGTIAGVLAAPNGNAITINAGANDAIVLEALAVQGAGVGNNGIVFNTGASLTVSRCIVQGFTGAQFSGVSGNGILIQPATGTPTITVTDTIASGNTSGGIAYYTSTGSAKTKLIATHVLTERNRIGIHLNANQSSGSLNVQVSDATLAHNSDTGIYVSGTTTTTALLDYIRAFNNGTGVESNYGGPPTITLLRRSIISGNQTGVEAHNGVIFYSYGDNSINGNATDKVGTISLAPLQ